MLQHTCYNAIPHAADYKRHLAEGKYGCLAEFADAAPQLRPTEDSLDLWDDVVKRLLIFFVRHQSRGMDIRPLNCHKKF